MSLLNALSCPSCGQPMAPVHGGKAGPAAIDICAKCFTPCITPATGGGSAYETVEGVLPFAQVAAPGSVVEAVLRSLAGGDIQIPTLPEIPQRVLAMATDPIVSLAEIGEVIAQDQSLFMRTKRTANSAFYGGVEELTDFRTICSRLGIRVLTQIAAAQAARGAFHSADPKANDIMRAEWEHSLAAAVCADRLAATFAPEARALVFSAALLQDIGRSVLLNAILVQYRGRVGELRSDFEKLTAMVCAVQLFAGLLVARTWNLAAHDRAAILFCHARAESLDDSLKPVVYLSQLAGALAHFLGHPGVEREHPPLAELPAISYFGLTVNDIRTHFAESRTQLTENLSAFNIN